MPVAVSWLQYLEAFSTALAAIGTLAAVLVALYLNVSFGERGESGPHSPFR